MSTVRDNERIPVVVLYESDRIPTFADVAKEYRFLGTPEVIQEQVIRVMKENAESLHFWLKQLCESAAMAGQVSNFTSIWIANAVALEATPAAIREIATQPNIERVMLNEPVPMLFDESREMTWGVIKLEASAVWPQYTGTGVRVAVIDTGVNVHPDLQGRVEDGKNYIDATQPPRDDHGHGTHCSGTVAGNGTMGTQTGIAPGATIIAIKVLGSGGSGAWANLWQAIEEAIYNNAKVISMSLGGFPDDTTRTRLRTACQTAISAGIILVIAAGNSGASGIGSPGDTPEVITIGAIDSSEAIASFSSRGPTKPWNGQTFVKPDVSGPGVGVISCSYNSNGYATMSGTSMATPHVAGVVALMLQAKPSLTCETARQVLEATAKDLGTPGKDNSYGAGLVNAQRAVGAAKSLAQVGRSDRFEMVVKELTFPVSIDANGNFEITQAIENDLMPGAVTIWVNTKETNLRLGCYKVAFTLSGPNGTKTGNCTLDFDHIPTNPNQYEAKYGFNVGNFELVQGQYTGSVSTTEPNPKVKGLSGTIIGKATWPAR